MFVTMAMVTLPMVLLCPWGWGGQTKVVRFQLTSLGTSQLSSTCLFTHLCANMYIGVYVCILPLQNSRRFTHVTASELFFYSLLFLPSFRGHFYSHRRSKWTTKVKPQFMSTPCHLIPEYARVGLTEVRDTLLIIPNSRC